MTNPDDERHGLSASSRWSGWVLVTLTICVLAIGNLLNKHVADQFDGASVHRFLHPLFILAFCLLLVRGLLWVFALRRLPLSLSYPFLSLSFPLILVLSWLFFHEAVTAGKIAGTVAIVAGVVLIGSSK